MLDYCSGVWGYDFENTDKVQNRAMRFFLEVNRFTPTHTLYGELAVVKEICYENV